MVYGYSIHKKWEIIIWSLKSNNCLKNNHNIKLTLIYVMNNYLNIINKINIIKQKK